MSDACVDPEKVAGACDQAGLQLMDCTAVSPHSCIHRQQELDILTVLCTSGTCLDPEHEASRKAQSGLQCCLCPVSMQKQSKQQLDDAQRHMMEHFRYLY